MKLFAARDTLERHAVAAQLLGAPATVVDVGGTPGGLAAALPQTRVVVANVEPPADVVLTPGAPLPFGDDAFDAAASLDVLEHLARDERARHLAELVRVARTRVVVCCPLGTPEHVRVEDELRARHGHRWLDGHERHGLPTEAELRELADGWTFRFHGDVHEAAARFRGRRNILARLRDARPPLDLELHGTARPATNRVFLVRDL